MPRNDLSILTDQQEQDALGAARNGDRAAAERLVEQTYSTIFASLFKMTGGNIDLAADLTQDTYRKAWESLVDFRGHSRFSTWLYRIAYTTFLNHVRRPNRVMSFDPEQLDPKDPAASAEDLLSRSEDLQRLRHAVLGLPDDLRFTVTAKFWGDLSVAEIAKLEGITGMAIRKRLNKAFAILELTLDEDES